MERISAYQAGLIGVVCVVAITAIHVPAQMMAFAKQHIYLSCLAGALVSAFSLWLLSRVSFRFPQHDLFEALITRFSAFGRIISFSYLLFFFFVLVRDIRVVTDFTNLFMLQRTPVIVLALLYVISAVLIARGGIEILARMTELFVPIMIILALFFPLLLAKFVNFAAFQPLLDVDWTGVGLGTWYVIPYIGEIILLPFLFVKQTFRARHGLSGLFLGTFLLLIVLVMELLVLGVEITPRMLFPTYALARQIEITDFLDRLDLFMFSLYLPTVMIKISYSLYFICHGLRRVVPRIDAKVVAAPVGLLAMSCSFWFFRSIVGVINLQHLWTGVALIFILVIPLLLFLILRPKSAEEA